MSKRIASPATGLGLGLPTDTGEAPLKVTITAVPERDSHRSQLSRSAARPSKTTPIDNFRAHSYSLWHPKGGGFENTQLHLGNSR